MNWKRPIPSQSLIKELLDYDPVTGVFIWKNHRFHTAQSSAKFAGRVAGTNSNGYRTIRVRGYYPVGAHRLAWIYVHGEIPTDMEIDHIDRNPSNNAILNLRLATRLDNAKNLTTRRNNRLGVRGVCLTRFGTYYARISVSGKEVSLGYFKNLEDAAAARAAGAQKYYGAFS